MSHDLRVLKDQQTKLAILYKLYQGQGLSYAEQQAIFRIVTQKFYDTCIGLNALLPSDALHPDKLRYHLDQDGKEVPDCSESQLRAHFHRMIDKIRHFLPDILYEMVFQMAQGINDLKENHSLTLAACKERDEEEAKFLPLATAILNRRKQEMHDQLLEGLVNALEPADRHYLVRRSLQAQDEMIVRWGPLLTERHRVIQLAGLDLSGVDFSDLNLRHVRFNAQNLLTHARLMNIEADPEQFIFVPTRDAEISEDLLSAIQTAKADFIRQKLTKVSERISEYRSTLAGLVLMERVACANTLPDLRDLRDDQVTQLIFQVMNNSFLNTLPIEDEAHQAKVVEHPEIILSKSRETCLQIFRRMLEARRGRLPSEVLAFAQRQKLALIFAQFAGVRDLLETLEGIFQDLSPRQQGEFQQGLASLIASFREMRASEGPLQTEYDQKFINASLAAFFEEADEKLDAGPAERLEAVLEGARHRDDLLVDLRGIDLARIGAFTADTDFSFVYVQLTEAQERQLSPKHKEQRYRRLFQGIQEGNQREIEMCLRQGLNINYQNPETGRTPFMSACVLNHPEIVDHLLAQGADPSIRTQATGMTVIESAARLQALGVVEVLRRHGAVLDFASAVYLGDIRGFEGKSAEEVKTTVDRYTGRDLLHIAVEQGNHALVDWLLNHGADVNAIDASRISALELACQKRDGVARLLLARGARVTKEIMHIACADNELSSLLRPQVEEIDLYTAIFLNETPVIHHLVNGQFDAEIEEGYTPLALACRLGNLEVVNWLLDSGANCETPARGLTPILHAVETDQARVVKCVLEHEVFAHTMIAGRISPFFTAVSEGRERIVEVMLAHYRAQRLGLNMVNTPHMNQTPLLVAAYVGNARIVQLLLEAGADPFARDLIGNTALHRAAEAGHFEIVALLGHAMLQPRNQAGRTPLELARANAQEATVELLRVFERPRIDEAAVVEANHLRMPLGGQMRAFAPVAEEADQAAGQAQQAPRS